MTKAKACRTTRSYVTTDLCRRSDSSTSCPAVAYRRCRYSSSTEPRLVRASDFYASHIDGNRLTAGECGRSNSRRGLRTYFTSAGMSYAQEHGRNLGLLLPNNHRLRGPLSGFLPVSEFGDDFFEVRTAPDEAKLPFGALTPVEELLF